ncbi:MAG: hypothetical protein IJN29_07520 [Akkermansia sp.]|nr:hypothetical protein [Akkermansia sp.]
MKLAKAALQLICTVLFLLLALSCCGATDGLTTGELWNTLQETAVRHANILLWCGILALQLVLMRWLGGIWNVVFSLLSIALMAELIMLAGGMQAAVTAPCYDLLSEAGLAQLTTAYPVLYWLVPTLWFLACLCAHDQVRVFITAVACYLLWLLLTWLLSLAVNTWLGMGDPAPEHLANLFRAYPWLTSAIPGAFLLIYAELMAVLEACLPKKKD